MDVLAKLHSLDPDKLGLSNYGPKKDFYPRQCKSLSRVSHAQAVVKSVKTGEAVGQIPRLDELAAWLTTHCPVGETSIVHGTLTVSCFQQSLTARSGDFKIDNLIFHPTEPRVIALLDWELSTLVRLLYPSSASL